MTKYVSKLSIGLGHLEHHAIHAAMVASAIANKWSMSYAAFGIRL